MQQPNEPVQPQEPVQPGKPTLSDAEIENFLNILTKMNNKSRHMDKLEQNDRMMTSILYTVAPGWLTKHNVSFTYDSKRRRYIRC